MSKSTSRQKRRKHVVDISRMRQRMKVRVPGAAAADSNDGASQDDHRLHVRNDRLDKQQRDAGTSPR